MGRWKRHAELLARVTEDDRFLAFVAYFNRDRDYFECHEVMEELWLEEGRSPLLQGLLQVAVGLHHWNNGNLSGASKLLGAGLEKLNEFGDVALGLDLASLRQESKRCLEALSIYGSVSAFRAFEIVVLDGDVRTRIANWELEHPPLAEMDE
ncbi:DUF309 domain-containing protein [Cohnella suwonensis]|uniref:DUF309 domain-containing protein n=1 Tax=Cohnella suwonensis TaxID=696072 RepID=A0ABW0LZL4_9BACL